MSASRLVNCTYKSSRIHRVVCIFAETLPFSQPAGSKSVPTTSLLDVRLNVGRLRLCRNTGKVRLVDGRPVFIEKRTGLKPSVQVWKPTDEADGQVKSHSCHIIHLWGQHEALSSALTVRLTVGGLRCWQSKEL